MNARSSSASRRRPQALQSPTRLLESWQVSCLGLVSNWVLAKALPARSVRGRTSNLGRPGTNLATIGAGAGSMTHSDWDARQTTRLNAA